ncbi:MAG: hypothetical protein B7Y45_09770 [Sphingomonas sp. 28-66-16]|nr:MAG: hypothetical protein B7Y45_09770 [Sphingomonas sp. 28-66-16]
MSLTVLLAVAVLVLASGALRARPPVSPADAAPAAPPSPPLRATEIQVSAPDVSPAAVTPSQAASPAVASQASPAPAEPAPTSGSAYVIKHILPIEGPLHLGDHYWDERGAPATGTIMITVDLAAQTLSVFRDGFEIGTSAILYGGDDKPTPLGVFPITQKDADHVSNLYDAKMPYMLRLTNDGISIHGTSVAEGFMTHGCIGVPTPFAKQLFAAVKLGDRVIVTRGKMVDVGAAISAG